MIKKLYLLSLLFFVSFFSGCLQSNQTETPTCFELKSVSLDQNTIPALVLGGGVAGLTSALYLSQANIPCMVIEGPKPGGALAQSHSVRNWPGTLNAPGGQIIEGMKEQVEHAKVPVLAEKVIDVDFSAWPYKVKTQVLGQEKVIEREALACIIATGAEPNYLGISGETGADGYWGRGVSNCAVCEGSLQKNKNVIVVGGGDAAIVEANYLSLIAKSVTLVVRKDHFRAKDIKARKRALAQENVKVLFNTEVKEITGDGNSVTEVVLKNNQTHEEYQFKTDAVFLAIGSRPNTKMFEKFVSLDERGFVKLDNYQESSVKGVFAAGDVCDPVFVQAVTSSGHGCMAALQAKQFLEAAGFDQSYFLENKLMADQLADEDELPEIVASEQTAPGVQQSPAGSVLELGSLEQAQKLFSAGRPVILDVFATWCPPCKQIAPVFADLAKEFSGAVDFVKLNTDNQNVDQAELFKLIGAQEVKGVPTFIFVKDGKELGRLVGGLPRDEFARVIKQAYGV